MIFADIRPHDDHELKELLALNQSETPHVGSITLERLKMLVSECAHFKVARHDGKLAGFIIALDQDAEYDSLNFQWFRSRYPRFMYVDRIAVAKDFRKQGLGRALYSEISKVSGNYPLIACEVNLKPPNPDSLEFHSRLGFKRVGTLETEGGSKAVVMLVKTAAGSLA